MVDPLPQFHAHRPLKGSDHARLPLIGFSIWSSRHDDMTALEQLKARPYFLIYWVAAGELLAVSGSSRIRVAKHQAIILPPGNLTGAETSGPHHRLQLKVTGACAAEIIPRLGLPLDQVFAAGPPPLVTFRRLQNALLDPMDGSDIAASQISYELLALLAQGGRRPPQGDLAAQAIELIRQHWQDPSLNINSLASMLQVNRSSLSQQFARATGASPSHYLRQYRLRQAVALLEGSDLLIGDVAQRCGFSGHEQFSRLVQQHLQQSPSQIRAGA